MNGIRYQITHIAPGQKGMSRLPVHDHSDAAHRAVALATEGSRDVLVMRFDPATGWDIVGMARTFASRLPGPATVIYQDARTGPQRDRDEASARTVCEAATPDDHAGPHARGHRSGMRVFGVARRLARQGRPS
jgi:hypothetical protein